MRRRVFDGVQERVSILRLSVRDSFWRDTAYFGENWAAVVSTVLYTTVNLLLMTIIFRNVRTVAGYTYGEMLTFAFVAQSSYYGLWLWSYNNVINLAEDINSGNLDLVLTKPLPSLYYLLTRRIAIVKIAREALPALGVLAVFIPWSTLGIRLVPALVAVLIFLCGQVAVNALQCLLIFPVFWSGGGRLNADIPFILQSYHIPLEGLTRPFATLFVTVIPVFLSTGLCVSVLFGKSPPGPALVVAVAATTGMALIRNAAWRVAIRHYTSASS